MGTASVLLNAEPKVARRGWPTSTHGFIRTLSQNRLNLAGALLMRVLDVFFAFPGLLLALAMIAALGSSIQNLVLTMGVLFAPSMARVTRGPVLSIRQKEFIEAARALGVREVSILHVHILPNVVAPIIVASTLQLSAAILIEAS